MFIMKKSNKCSILLEIENLFPVEELASAAYRNNARLSCRPGDREART